MLIQSGEPNPIRRTVPFYLVQADGITPAEDEEGGQPRIRINDGPWLSTGIGTLVKAANGIGDYDAVLDLASTETLGLIRTQYSSINTPEIPGPLIQVVAFDPFSIDESGSGDLIVDQDMGGVDNLQFVDALDHGIDGALIFAYLKSEWDANPATAKIRGKTVTKADGRWSKVMRLDSGFMYHFLFIAEGYQVESKEVLCQ
jgi:hypothetical protein